MFPKPAEIVCPVLCVASLPQRYILWVDPELLWKCTVLRAQRNGALQDQEQSCGITLGRCERGFVLSMVSSAHKQTNWEIKSTELCCPHLGDAYFNQPKTKPADWWRHFSGCFLSACFSNECNASLEGTVVKRMYCLCI